MASGVVLLVLASAFLHALWNALLKRAKDPELAVVGMLSVSALTSLVTVVVLGVPVPPAHALGYCVVAGVLEAAYFATLARALARAPLGPVYTVVRGGGLVVLWPVAILALGERANAMTLSGSALVVAGLAATGLADGLGKNVTSRGLGWAAVCAVFVGGYHVAYKLALAAGAAPAFVNTSLVVAAAVQLIAIGSAKRRGGLEALRAEPVRIILAGVLGSAGFVVFLTALANAGAGAAFTLRNTSILFAQLFSALQRERPKPLALLGAVLVTGGAILLSR